MNEILSTEEVCQNLLEYLLIAEPAHLAFIASQNLPYQLKYLGDDQFEVINPEINLPH